MLYKVCQGKISMDFGRWLKNERLKNHLNQSQLAKKAGLSQGLISGLERNNIELSIPTCKSLSKALDVSFDEILKFTDFFSKEELVINAGDGVKLLNGIMAEISEIAETLSTEKQIVLREFAEFLAGKQTDSNTLNILKAA